jgi:hypothetical protein
MTTPSQRDFSISELSEMTGHARHSLARWFDEAGLKPRRSGQGKRYKLSEAFRVLLEVGERHRVVEDLAQSKTRIAFAQAGIAEIRLERLQAEVVETNLALQLIEADRQLVRQRLLRLPDELLRATETVQGVDALRTALMDGVVAALNDLSEGCGMAELPDFADEDNAAPSYQD